jgi:hypothetical protein
MPSIKVYDERFCDEGFDLRNSDIELNVVYASDQESVFNVNGKVSFYCFGIARLGRVVLEMGRYVFDFGDCDVALVTNNGVVFDRVELPKRPHRIGVPVPDVPDQVDVQQAQFEAMFEEYLRRRGHGAQGQEPDPGTLDGSEDQEFDDAFDEDNADEWFDFPIDEYSLVQTRVPDSEGKDEGQASEEVETEEQEAPVEGDQASA